MTANLEFLCGILEREEPPLVAAEDFDGIHGDALRLWQQMGFIDAEPGRNPAPSCPYCFEGVPYLGDGRHVCSACFSTVDERHLLVWPLRLQKVLHWLAGEWSLSGGVQQIDSALWQLGTRNAHAGACECFFWRGGILSEPSRQRLFMFRSAVLFYGTSRPDLPPEITCRVLSLLEGLRMNGSLTAITWSELVRDGGAVRFDVQSGALRAGDVWLGEVPYGSREYFFLRHLAAHLDHFVAYADLKHAVLAESGSRDGTEEATFCHRLKNRIKEKGWIPTIDSLLVTTNKGAGYRLRGRLNRPPEVLCRI